jgi:uncharacterized protein HemX
MDSSRRQTLLSTIAIIGVVVALGALAVAIIALKKGQTDTTRIHALQAQVRQVDAAETQTRLTEATSQLASLQERFGKVSSAVAGFVNCVPELQTEIGGLSINWHITPLDASEDSFSIANGRQISRNCEDVLYGSKEEPGK